MQDRRWQSASQEEWSLLLSAMRQVQKDVVAYEGRLTLKRVDPRKLDLDFNQDAPQFHHLEDANECIQRLWSICAELSDQQQLIRDRIEKDSSNSSMPPSSDSIAAKVDRYNTNYRSYVLTGRKQGAPRGHRGHGRGLSPCQSGMR